MMFAFRFVQHALSIIAQMIRNFFILLFVAVVLAHSLVRNSILFESELVDGGDCVYYVEHDAIQLICTFTMA